MQKPTLVNVQSLHSKQVEAGVYSKSIQTVTGTIFVCAAAPGEVASRSMPAADDNDFADFEDFQEPAQAHQVAPDSFGQTAIDLSAEVVELLAMSKLDMRPAHRQTHDIGPGLVAPRNLFSIISCLRLGLSSLCCCPPCLNRNIAFGILT